jgi:TRAP transporter TAXI family solute receptor
MVLPTRGLDPLSSGRDDNPAPNMRDALKVYLPVLAILMAAGLLVWNLMAPAPPHDLTIAAGPADGAYAAYAERYRKILAADGLTLDIVHTSGSIENQQLLAESKVDVAFVQGGTVAMTDSGDPPTGVEALASLYYEPLWVFVRGIQAPERLTQLAGKRIAIGPDGSGTRPLALTLLGADGVNAIGTPGTVLLPLGGTEAAQALLNGSADAAFFVTGKVSPAMRSLINAPTVRLMNFAQAEALSRRLPFLSAVTLPRGGIDLARDIPARPMTLIAPAAQLVARDTINPALVDALLGAANKIHRQGTLFERSGEFPSRDFLELPLNAEAEHYFVSGPSVARRYLPFWAASVVERALILLLPLLTLAIPLMKFAPGLYKWQVSRRILRWYRHLRQIEGEMEKDDISAERRQALIDELDSIQAQVAHVHVPGAYAQSLYDLRVHIGFVRDLIGPTAR